jgi:arsenical pump membrane protein
MQEMVAYGTLMMTLGLVLYRPRIGLGLRVGPAAAAALGVAVLLATGVVSPADLADTLGVLWRPSLAILSIMLTTNVAQRLGILDHFAGLLEPRPGQPVGRLFRSVFALSAVTSAVLNNDAAVLLLTPLIVRLIRRRYPNRPDLVVPFAFAVFAAAGVAPLVISNPMNLIVAEFAGIGFNAYAARMIPIAIAGWVTAYAILRAVFRRRLLGDTGGGEAGRSTAPRLSRPAKQFLALFAAALGAYPALSYAGGPVWAVAAGSAALGAWMCWHHRIASPVQLAAAVSWEVLLFLFFVFVLVLGLRNVGLVERIANLYNSPAGPAAQVVVIGFSSAVGSSLLNNHPMAILNALAIRSLPDGTQWHMLAALIGGDLGPRLLPMGSLAGLLWLDSLRRQGVHIGLSRFIVVGLAVTLPTLGVSLAMLLLGMAYAGP